MNAIPDHQLLVAYRAGDSEAYAVVVARHHAFVRAVYRRSLAGGGR